MCELVLIRVLKVDFVRNVELVLISVFKVDFVRNVLTGR